ncbi:MAG: hypothetical protein HY929_04670 [Euryarchaeota archaeon]|nr:hypothetical protein [Euryarchaeota archaeon]
MDRKILISILILLSIILLLVLFLPVSFPHYVGAHTWYKMPKCTACHKYIVNEIDSSNQTVNWPHIAYKQISNKANNTQCRECHIKYGSVSGHNASYINCTKCHNATYFPGYNSTSPYSTRGWGGIRSGIHKPFNASGKNNRTLNFGCLGCHTSIAVNVTFLS